MVGQISPPRRLKLPPYEAEHRCFFVKPGCVLATLADTLGEGQGLAARHLKIQQKEWCAEFALVACRGEEDSASIWICSRLRPLYYPNQLPCYAEFYHTSGLAVSLVSAKAASQPPKSQ